MGISDFRISLNRLKNELKQKIIRNKKHNFYFCLSISALFLISIINFSCSSKTAIVRKDMEKSSVVTEDIKKAEEEQEVEIEGMNLWVKDWNVLVYSNAGHDKGVVTMVKKGAKLSPEKSKGERYKVKANEFEGWINNKSTSKTQIKGIEIKKKKITKAEKKKVKEYLEKGKYYRDTDEYIIHDNKKVPVGGDYRTYDTKAEEYFIRAYEIDPNNLEVIRELVTSTGDDYISSYLVGFYNKHGTAGDFIIKILNYALELNPPDKEWWYNILGFYYEDDNKKLALFIYKKGLEFLEIRKDYENEYFPLFLYNIAELSNNLKEKKLYYERIINEYPEWNKDTTKVNINDAKRNYKYLLIKLNEKFE